MVTLIKFPSGRFGFVGRIPIALGFINKDNSKLTDKQIEDFPYMMTPSLFGIKTRSFESLDEALKEAENIGVSEITVHN